MITTADTAGNAMEGVTTIATNSVEAYKGRLRAALDFSAADRLNELQC